MSVSCRAKFVLEPAESMGGYVRIVSMTIVIHAHHILRTLGIAEKFDPPKPLIGTMSSTLCTRNDCSVGSF